MQSFDIALLNGNACTIPLRDGSVQCVITSPPYWGLRDYGLAPVIFPNGAGGCAEGQHVWGKQLAQHKRGKVRDRTTLQGGKQERIETADQGNFCRRCGAWRGQLGLEPAPDLYVSHLVQVFREIRRVLRPDGTVWLNLGDSYANYDSTTVDRFDKSTLSNANSLSKRFTVGRNKMFYGIKRKDLVGIPWRTAFALQADGWYLRCDIIWEKPNPMSESVTDRPTHSHEYVFLLAKSQRYYYDAEAIREPQTGNAHSRGMGITPKSQPAGNSLIRANDSFHASTSQWHIAPDAARNRRSVWTIATESYSGAHFATFPQKLVEPMILAGTSAKGACPTCGAPWERVITRVAHYEKRQDRTQPNGVPAQVDSSGWKPATITEHGWLPSCDCYGYHVPPLPIAPEGVEPPVICEACQGAGVIVFDNLFGHQELPCQECDGTGGDEPTDEWMEFSSRHDAIYAERIELLKAIDQDAPTVPCTVLDPFAGTGTVARVSAKHRRRSIAIELKPDYLKLATQRTSNIQMALLPSPY